MGWKGVPPKSFCKAIYYLGAKKGVYPKHELLGARVVTVGA